MSPFGWRWRVKGSWVCLPPVQRHCEDLKSWDHGWTTQRTELLGNNCFHLSTYSFSSKYLRAATPPAPGQGNSCFHDNIVRLQGIPTVQQAVSSAQKYVNNSTLWSPKWRQQGRLCRCRWWGPTRLGLEILLYLYLEDVPGVCTPVLTRGG